MRVDLDKIDLVNLVSSVSPYYNLFHNPLVSKLGEWRIEQYEWAWKKYILEELSEQELYDLYQLCKSSWK